MLEGAVAERDVETMPEVTVRTVYRWSKAQTPPLHAKLVSVALGQLLADRLAGQGG